MVENTSNYKLFRQIFRTLWEQRLFWLVPVILVMMPIIFPWAFLCRLRLHIIEEEFKSRQQEQPQLYNKRPSPDQAAANYLNNLKLINSICLSHGIKYMAALQPTLAAQEQPVTNFDHRIIKQRESQYLHGYSVIKYCRKFYQTVRSERDPIVNDLSQIFSQMNDQVYYDSIHISDKGQDLVAKRLSRLVLELEKQE